MNFYQQVEFLQQLVLNQDRFQRSIGWKKATDEEYNTLMREEYFDPIERFPEKIDQLLAAINRINEVLFHEIKYRSFICFRFI